MHRLYRKPSARRRRLLAALAAAVALSFAVVRLSARGAEEAGPTSPEQLARLLSGRRYPLASVCCIVRTYPGQALQLSLMLDSLFVAARAGNVSVHAYVMNTDPDAYEDTAYIEEAIARSAAKARPPSAAELAAFPGRRPWRGFYGYDYTQFALDRVLDAPNSSCSHVLVTNGDNLFSVSLFALTVPSVLRGADLVAWHFVTHHHRRKRVNQLVRTKFALSFIDLSSALFRVDALRARRGAANFVPQGRDTKDAFERDWRFVRALVQAGVSKVVVPSVLMFHQ